MHQGSALKRESSSQYHQQPVVHRCTHAMAVGHTNMHVALLVQERFSQGMAVCGLHKYAVVCMLRMLMYTEISQLYTV